MTFSFIPDYPDATDEQKMEQVRNWRDLQLAESDWTQLPDAPVDSQAWAIYRQALRDIPQNFASPDDVVWPEAP